MGFTVTLDLGGLNKRFHARPQFQQLLVQRTSVKVCHGKHTAIAQIAVVGNRQYLGPEIIGELIQRAPQILGILAVKLRERVGLACYFPVPTEHDIAVQVIATDGGPLVTYKSGEATRLIVFIGQLRVGLPRLARGFGIVDRRIFFGQ